MEYIHLGEGYHQASSGQERQQMWRNKIRLMGSIYSDEKETENIIPHRVIYTSYIKFVCEYIRINWGFYKLIFLKIESESALYYEEMGVSLL